MLASRRALTGALIAVSCALGLMAAGPAFSQEYPNKPITLICAFPAGGAGDLALRAMAEVAGKHLGQPIVVDNRVGGSGTVGPAGMAATAKPDGYTLSQAVVVLLRLPHMQKVAFEPLRDFTYVANVTAYTFGIVAKADGPFKSWADLEAFARANPGKVTYASPGVGTSLHIGMEEIAARTGLKFTHVPMKGAGESSAAVLGDHVMLQVDATNWKPLVDAGKLRPLMVWSQERLKSLPDVPTLSELIPTFKGDIPAMFESPFGIVGPKGMDPAIVAKLDAAFKKATEDPGVQALLAKYDMYPKYKSAADYRKFAETTWELERKVLERLGMLKKD